MADYHESKTGSIFNPDIPPTTFNAGSISQVSTADIHKSIDLTIIHGWQAIHP